MAVRLMIKLQFISIDGIRKTRAFNTLKAARLFAVRMVGPQDVADLSLRYAVSGDGVCKIAVAEGTTLRELFSVVEAPVFGAIPSPVRPTCRCSPETLYWSGCSCEREEAYSAQCREETAAEHAEDLALRRGDL